MISFINARISKKDFDEAVKYIKEILPKDKD